jgi:hypothetical protein
MKRYQFQLRTGMTVVALWGLLFGLLRTLGDVGVSLTLFFFMTMSGTVVALGIRRVARFIQD